MSNVDLNSMFSAKPLPEHTRSFLTYFYNVASANKETWT